MNSVNVASYEDNPLIHEIREEYSNGGEISSGATETSGVVQNKLRSSNSESGGTRRKSTSSKRGVTRGKGRTTRSGTAPKRSNIGKRRTDSTSDKVSSSPNGSDESANGEIQLPESEIEAQHYDPTQEGERPSGLDTVPHPKERKIREEQEERARSPKEKESKNLFSWLHLNHRGDSKETRSKPFSEREAQEVRPALISAMLDTFMYADELIYATHKAHNHVQIWQSIDEEETGMLADVWLTRARRDAKAAAHIETLVNRHAEIKVGLILAPRFYQTIRTYVDGGGFSVR